MIVLEAKARDNATEEEEDISQHDEVSGKYRDKDEWELEEEGLHDEGHRDPREEKNIES